MAEKMRRFSPYNYAFNNPIRFVDPDGMKPAWIEGTDGRRVTYTINNGKVTWSNNASNATKKIGNALVANGNASVLAQAKNAAYPVSFKESSEVHPTKMGFTLLSWDWYESRRSAVIKRADITLYDGSVQKMISEVKNGATFSPVTRQTELYEDAIKNNDYGAIVSANAAHEITHAANPIAANQTIKNKQLGTNFNVETLPEAAETKSLENSKIIRETLKTVKAILNLN